MTTVVLLLALGVVLLVLEVVVPGGVLGVLGGLAMLGGCAVAFHHFGAAGGGLTALIALGTLGFALYVEFFLLPRTRIGRRFFLQQASDGRSQPPKADATIVGRTADTVTTLAPTGYVMLDGRRYEARSQSGLIARGATVRVVGVDSFHLIVSQL